MTVTDIELTACRATLAKDGVCVVPNVLSRAQAADVRRSLTEAAELYRQNGGETFLPYLDPNDRNIRVFNLIGLHADFRDLILHPTALALVTGLLGDGYMISNFTANIALPGSASMALHADQALVAPSPWLEPGRSISSGVLMTRMRPMAPRAILPEVISGKIWTICLMIRCR